jgi:hypothetical protein
MKGVTFLTDVKRNRTLVQIDLTEIIQRPNKLEELVDILVAAIRKDEKKIPWKKAKQELKRSGKL